MKKHVLFAAAALAIPAAVLAARIPAHVPVAAIATPAPMPTPISTIAPQTVTVSPGKLSYRLPGEFQHAERPVDPPADHVRFRRAFEIMTYQVSARDYARCVTEGACEAVPPAPADGDDLPVTGVNFRDATAYAEWLSKRTGETWRLPTDEEWAYAAAERFDEKALEIEDTANPATRWIARYLSEAEAARGSDPQPKPQGHFGPNSNGIYDVAGNVWEWTSTCYRRAALDQRGRIDASTDNCGVRVVGGRHRGYMSFFIRDGKSGGCAAGLPPDNLGIRLVKERPSRLAAFRALWRRDVL
ncbi:SUMF1/EgtB/PvdO family nonheme iron enzyme [Aquamicrobium terrae]